MFNLGVCATGKYSFCEIVGKNINKFKNYVILLITKIFSHNLIHFFSNVILITYFDTRQECQNLTDNVT